MKMDFKSGKFNRKAALAAVCLTCALGVTACSRNNTNQNQDPLTGEDMSQQENAGGEGTSEDGSSGEGSDQSSNALGEFEQMLGDERNDANSIMDYINTNIVGAGVNEVERFFSGLLSFGDDIRNIDFTRLNDSRQYMPEDMIAFMDLMKLEYDTPSMAMSDSENRRVINMTLSEMLERALLFEQHLKKYPNAVTTDAASRLYEEIATNAISGGYNKTEGIVHYYKGDSDDVIDQEALKYYQQFAAANADSNLGKVVQEYIGVLQSNNFQITDAMEDFYRGLHQKLDVKNWAGSTNNTNNTNGNNTNGNNTNGNSTDTTNNNKTTNDNEKGTETADTVIEGTASR